MSAGAERRPDLLEAALDLIARDGWRGYSALTLAEATDAGLAEICLQLGDGGAVLAALGRRADAAMIDVAASELLELTPRERVFELMMRRFDALRPARGAFKRLRDERSGDALLPAFGNLRRAMRLVCEAAGMPARGPHAFLRLAALGQAYVRTGRVWLDDDDPDQSATLAELDKQLGRMSDLLQKGRAGGPSTS